MSDLLLDLHSLTRTQIRGHLVQMLERKSKSLQDIVRTLKVYRDNVEEDTNLATLSDAPPSQKEILQYLINFLEGC